ESLGRGVARLRALPLHREQASDDAQALDGDFVAAARGFGEPAPAVAPAAGALAARALDEGGDARAVALHAPMQLVAKKPPHAVRIAGPRIEEGHPARVRPA